MPFANGDVVAVEAEVRAEFSGILLPMVGYADLVLLREGGVQIIDFKVTASKPSPDPMLDPLDLQKLALTRGLEVESGGPVTGWTWQHLVKTKTPQIVDNSQPVSGCVRVRDIRRLAGVVQPTVIAMADVINGRRVPVTTQAPVAMCGTRAFRGRCSARAS